MVYNVTALQNEYKMGKTYPFVFFWGHHPSADGRITESCLSQWWSCQFQIDGIVYHYAEQYMMAEKARLFGDDEMLEKIMNASHPKEMKAYGRAVKHFQESVWNQHCYEIVKRGNLAKFSQNPQLCAFLKKTTGKILVEASPFDTIWGIGLEKKNPDVSHPDRWRGTNLLGFALTEVRDQLLEEEVKK